MNAWNVDMTVTPKRRPPPIWAQAGSSALLPPPWPGSPLLLPNLLPVHRSPAQLVTTPDSARLLLGYYSGTTWLLLKEHVE